jgi:transcriptional regulator with XRE-family HTH domain
MARAALKWTTLDLAKAAGVGGNTVNRFEAGADAQISSASKMEAALRDAGISFSTTADGQECVCCTPKQS